MNDISAVVPDLPKVLLHELLDGAPAQSPDALTAQVREHLEKLAADHVVTSSCASPRRHTPPAV